MNSHLLAEIAKIRSGKGDAASRERVAHMIAEEGLDSPASFASFVVELVEAQNNGKFAEPLHTTAVDSFAQQIDARKGSITNFDHRPPATAFYWQGKMLDPGDIRKFNDRPLHSIILGSDTENAALMVSDHYSEIIQLIRGSNYASILTSNPYKDTNPPGLEVIDHFESSTPPGVDLQIHIPSGYPDENGVPTGEPGMVPCPADAPRPSGETQFFEHHNFDGDWFWLPTFHGRQNLTKIGWNDRISSVRGGERLTMMWDHENYQGSSHTIAGHGTPTADYGTYVHPMCGSHIQRWIFPAPRQELRDLSIIGFSDRISSVAHI